MQLTRPKFKDLVVGRSPFKPRQELSPLLCTGEEIFRKSRNSGVVGSPFRRASGLSRSQKNENSKEGKSLLVMSQAFRKQRRGSVHKSMAAIGNKIEQVREEYSQKITQMGRMIEEKREKLGRKKEGGSSLKKEDVEFLKEHGQWLPQIQKRGMVSQKNQMVERKNRN